MAEEVDVGGIVATVRIDTEKADSALNSVINALSKFATAIETAIAAVEKVSGKTDTLAAAIDKVGAVSNTATGNVSTLAPAVEQVNKASQSAAQSVGKLNTTISSTAPDKYSQKLSKLNGTLETQKQKVAELYAELDKMQEVYVEAEIGMGHDVTDYNPLNNSAFSEIISQIDKEESKLHDIQAQIASVAAERERAASVAVSASQKQASAANTVSAAVGKQTKEVSASGMVLDTSATALRAVTSAAGGTASKVGYLATELMYLKRNIQAATTAASAMGGIISFVVMAAITLVTSAISSMQEAEEKRQEAFAEGVENYKKYSEELRALEQNIAVLNDSKSTTEQLASARNELASTFDDMIIGYDEEGSAILANTEQMEKYIDLLYEEIEINRRQISQNPPDFSALKKYNQYAQETVEGYEKLLERARELKNEPIVNFDAMKALIFETDWVKSFENTEEGIKEAFDATITYLEMEYADAIAYQDRLFKNTAPAQEYADYISAYIKIAMGGIDGIAESWEHLSKEQRMVGESMLKDIVLACIKGERDWQTESSNIVAEFREKLSDTGYIEQQYNNLITSSHNAVLRAQQLAEAYDNVNSAVSNAMSGLGGVQSDMASAFAELSENGKLAQSTVNGLIGSYPQLIDYLDTETGQLELTEGVMRELYDIQKELRIAELEASKAKLAENEAEIQSNYALAESRLSAAKAAFLQNGGSYSLEFFAAMDEYSDAQKNLEELEANYSRIEKLIESISGMELNLTGSSSGGYNSAASKYSEALEKINHQKRMGQLTTEQEIAALEELGEKYSLTADEQMDLEYRLYSVKKQYQEELEKAHTEALNDRYEQMSNLKSLGRLTAEEELEWLEKIRDTYQMNADERIALEIKIYNLKQELYQDEIDALGDLGDAVTEALKAQYEAQKAAEEKRINDSIEAWDDWEEATVSNIQAEIDALEALEKEQESQAAAAEYYQKSQELKLKIAYEKDDYQREQYQKELNRIAQKEEERLRKEQAEAKKTELQSQIEDVHSTADARREALNAELDVINENYGELTSALSLRAQAEQIIMQRSQEDIVELITSYAPDYNIAGQSIGESLYEGLKSKVDGIYGYVADVMTAITDYQERAKAVAAQAAADFEAAYQKSRSSGATTNTTVVNYTSNFNTPVQSPVQTKRAIESTASNIAAMLQ